MINFIKKLIPVEIKIKSLYWKQKESEMESDLIKIYHKLDIDEYDGVQEMIDEFHHKWDGMKMPLWLGLKSAEISRAQAMYVFLTAEME